MKRIRKIITIILCITMLLLSVVPSFAAEDKSDDTNYSFLLEQGYPETFLNKLTEDAMQKLVDEIGDGYVTDIKIDKCYLNEGEIVTLNAIDPNTLTIEFLSSYVCNKKTKKINSVVITATWDWIANRPRYRGKDTICVNWNCDVFTFPGGFYAEDLYRSDSSKDWSTFKTYQTPEKSAQGAISYTTDLKALKKYVGGTMILPLEPVENMYKGTAKSTGLNFEYAHPSNAVSKVSVTAGGKFGLSLEFGSGVYNTTRALSFKYSKTSS